jgi:hypothetical protein
MPRFPNPEPGSRVTSFLKMANDFSFRLGLARWLPVLFLFTLFSGGACDILEPSGSEGEEPDQGQVKVLFIGASYLAVNDMPGILAGFAEEAGKELFVAERVRVGHYLDYFSRDRATAEAIRRQDWDFVILSGGCQTAAYPETHHLILGTGNQHHPYPALQELKRKVEGNNPETVLIYMMPWAFEDGMTWVQGQFDNYFAMQERIRENALAWADSLDLVVAPVGVAWRAIMKGRPPVHYLYQSDWNHPGPRGSFLSAAVLYSTLFREGSKEIPFRWTLDASEAASLRRVASEVVMDSLAVWGIAP